MSARFVICVAPGALESQAVLLCRSIRRYGGVLRDAPITAFGSCAAPVDATLRELGVDRRPHGERFPPLPMANKLFAAATVEAEHTEDIIVVVDSDSLIVAEPGDLLLCAGHDAAVRPVNTTSVATTGPGHPMEAYWHAAYELCGVRPPPYVRMTVGGAKIRGFWNSGLVALRRSAALAASWRRDFLRLVAARHLPPGGKLNQLEQVALAATLARRPDRILVLDGRYNYPLPLRHRLDGSLRDAELDDLVHVHHFGSLHEPDSRESLGLGAVARWLAPQLPLEPTSYGKWSKPSYRLP